MEGRAIALASSRTDHQTGSQARRGAKDKDCGYEEGREEMNPEQVDRAIEFILNEQARITTNFEMYADQSRQEMKEFRRSLEDLKEAQAETDHQLRALATMQQESFQMLSKKQAHTDATLNTFMEAMSQFVTEVRNKL